jgi:hypothetical protein
MSFRIAPVAALLSVSALLTTPRALPSPDGSGLVVHEWGTFTSIAAEDGSAQRWTPRESGADLPCFVDRVGLGIKGDLSGTVRMETPVLYFYTPTALTVDVRVRFRDGLISEWYPTASVTPTRVMPSNVAPGGEATASWTGVKVQPGPDPAYPVEPAANHYYHARDTDAAPLQVGPEREKFLFYRGVGQFSPSIGAALQPDGRISLTSHTDTPIGDIIVFQRRAGLFGYAVHPGIGRSAIVDVPGAEDEGQFPSQELESLLTARGLYAKESSAMVRTWRDSWFEDGLRVFYLPPQTEVDGILPLDIQPAPASIIRVFVGRLEIFTPETVARVQQALAAGDTKTLRAYGRFLRPIAERVLAGMSPSDRDIAQRRLFAVPITTSSCGR